MRHDQIFIYWCFPSMFLFLKLNIKGSYFCLIFITNVKNKVWNLMAISRYSENYCYDVIYDYNSFRQMSQDEMTIIILFRLDTILDGKFKPNSFNASWFQGEGFYCFLLVFCHFCWLSVWYRIHISSKWSKWAINDIKFFFFYRVLKLLSYCSIYFADSKGAS